MLDDSLFGHVIVRDTSFVQLFALRHTEERRTLHLRAVIRIDPNDVVRSHRNPQKEPLTQGNESDSRKIMVELHTIIVDVGGSRRRTPESLNLKLHEHAAFYGTRTIDLTPCNIRTQPFVHSAVRTSASRLQRRGPRASAPQQSTAAVRLINPRQDSQRTTRTHPRSCGSAER